MGGTSSVQKCGSGRSWLIRSSTLLLVRLHLEVSKSDLSLSPTHKKYIFEALMKVKTLFLLQHNINTYFGEWIGGLQTLMRINFSVFTKH